MATCIKVQSLGREKSIVQRIIAEIAEKRIVIHLFIEVVRLYFRFIQLMLYPCSH